MPVISKAQGRFLGMKHPDVLAKWKAEGASTSTKGLPYHAGKAKKPRKGMISSLYEGREGREGKGK